MLVRSLSPTTDTNFFFKSFACRYKQNSQGVVSGWVSAATFCVSLVCAALPLH